MGNEAPDDSRLRWSEPFVAKCLSYAHTPW